MFAAPVSNNRLSCVWYSQYICCTPPGLAHSHRQGTSVCHVQVQAVRTDCLNLTTAPCSQQDQHQCRVASSSPFRIAKGSCFY